MFSKYSFIQIFPKHHIPFSTKLWFSLYEIKCNATVPTSQSILQLHQEKEGQVKCINTTRFRRRQIELAFNENENFDTKPKGICLLIPFR